MEGDFSVVEVLWWIIVVVSKSSVVDEEYVVAIVQKFGNCHQDNIRFISLYQKVIKQQSESNLLGIDETHLQ